MMKILVVDDEASQANAFAEIIKSMKPEYLVYKAFDGTDRIYSEDPADVIITDIIMPGLSGLDMIDRISDLGGRPEIIILSGYGEFRFAQKAINLGVSEYLLKPVTKADINRILDRLEKKLLRKNSEKSNETNENGLKEKLENTLPVYIEHLLNSWMFDMSDGRDIDEIRNILPGRGFFNVLATRIRKFTRLESMYSGEEIKKIMRHLKGMMNGTLSRFGHPVSFFSDRDKNIMITILTTENHPDLETERSKIVLKSLAQTIQNELGLSATIGVGMQSHDLYRGISDCYEQAIKAQEYSFYNIGQNVVFYSDIKNENFNCRQNLYAFEEELSGITCKSVGNIQVKSICNVFEKYANKLYGVKQQKLKEYLYYSAIHMIKSVKFMLVEDHYYNLMDNARETIFEGESYFDLKYAFIDLVEKLAGYFANTDNRNNYHVVERCRKFIQEHYMEDLSLENVAEMFHFSPSYFSCIFKSYAGTGFSEFLTAVRLAKAQDFLKNTNLKVYEVSEKVGYKDATYFNRIFKRETGVSPYKYRHLSGEL